MVGMLLAIFGGIWAGKDIPNNDTVVAFLLIAGVIIGFLNVTAKEAPVVLAAAVAFIILGMWGVSYGFSPVYNLSEGLWENLVGIVDAFAILMTPAAIIIAIKVVFATANRD